VTGVGDVQTALQLLQRVGSSFGLPVNNVSLDFIRGYADGEGLGTHIDLVPKHPWTWDRTVSFSILLSDRKDFAGGDLIVNGKTMRAGVGDLIGFTAVTPHSVTPVTRGSRYVWLGSGELLR
jgi:predicted 2-oxoglutarate/Fe(II)-dependent dioxygenase YbiX